jgi:hypothetical protein
MLHHPRLSGIPSRLMVFLLALILVPNLSQAASILYDTTNLSIGFGTVISTSPSNQLGNEIMLTGTHPVAQLVTDFDLFYRGFVPLSGQTLTGQGTATLRFWTNDTSPNLIFQSTALPVLSGSLGIQTLSFDNLHVVVPRTFVWTAQFGGITSGYSTPAGLAPVTGTVVGTQLATWLGPGAGVPSPSSPNYIFEATVKGTPLGTGGGSVPGPSSLVLLACSFAALIAWRLRKGTQ